MRRSTRRPPFGRQRSRKTSRLAGIISTVFSLCLFYYRHYHDRVFNWDLFAVGVTFVVVKLGLMDGRSA